MSALQEQTLPEGGKARRVYLLLRDEIVNGLHRPGQTLPSEQRLCTEYAVSRVTVRRALDALESDGLIEKRVGSGSRVTGSAEAATLPGDIATLMPQVADMGQNTTARLLSFTYAIPPEAIATALGLADAEEVQRAVRVREVSGRPFSHLTTFVPADIARHYSEADLATAPLFRLLERSGVRIDTASQSVTATLATPEVAEALEIAAGSALLMLTRVVRAQDGRGVEHLTALYRPDTFRLDMTLSRVDGSGGRKWEPVIGADAEAGP
ncbi:MAG: GntR family transcriptional regulator [Pseudomonadota bacterium]